MKPTVTKKVAARNTGKERDAANGAQSNPNVDAWRRNGSQTQGGRARAFGPGRASPQFRAFLRSRLGSCSIADQLDRDAIRQSFIYAPRNYSALVRGLEGVRDAIGQLDPIDRHFMKPILEPFLTALQAFIPWVAVEVPALNKSGLSRLRPQQSLPMTTSKGTPLSMDRMMSSLMVFQIDKHLKGADAVTAYRFAVRDYLGREVESDEEVSGDARREMRRIRQGQREGDLPIS